jgi:hypothetical protein
MCNKNDNVKKSGLSMLQRYKNNQIKLEQNVEKQKRVHKIRNYILKI